MERRSFIKALAALPFAKDLVDLVPIPDAVIDDVPDPTLGQLPRSQLGPLPPGFQLSDANGPYSRFYVRPIDVRDLTMDEHRDYINIASNSNPDAVMAGPTWLDLSVEVFLDAPIPDGQFGDLIDIGETYTAELNFNELGIRCRIHELAYLGNRVHRSFNNPDTERLDFRCPGLDLVEWEVS